jgi:hypothetical protein
MSHTYTNLLTHVFFSTKDREPLITAALHDDLLAYLGGIVREIGGALRLRTPDPTTRTCTARCRRQWRYLTLCGW